MIEIYDTEALRENRPPPRQVIVGKWTNTDVIFCIQCPDGVPDDCQNVMGSKLYQDPCYDFFMRFQPLVFAQSCIQTVVKQNHIGRGNQPDIH